MKRGKRVLVVRLGAMGDVVQTLPSVASLKHSMPHSEIIWVIESKWSALLEGNPYVDRVIVFERGTLAGLKGVWRELRRKRFDLAVDFQGLIKSALVAACARPERLYGFDSKCAREAQAAWFYSSRVHSDSAHRVDKYLDLAIGAGVTNPLKVFPMPSGSPQGKLPRGEFILASPNAGWRSKEWPLEYYAALGERLRRECRIPLVPMAPSPFTFRELSSTFLVFPASSTPPGGPLPLWAWIADRCTSPQRSASRASPSMDPRIPQPPALTATP